ncbi:MAG: sigma-70 family RNA polymerase sigma factor [Bacteroidales bacterium]|nr:sigma-70 family RNA polymerase sigma factor [Bacteroidales bacterium]
MKFIPPIPYPTIARWPDPKIATSLLNYEELPTAEFFYGKSYPVFKSLHSRYTTDASNVVEFINDIYLDLLRPRPDGRQCKLASYDNRCALHNWVGVVALRHCYAKYKRALPQKKIAAGDRKASPEPSIMADMNAIDRSDAQRIIALMPNERYRQLVTLRYLDGMTNEQVAAQLGLSMDNYYNKHRLAKVQYMAAYMKENSK